MREILAFERLVEEAGIPVVMISGNHDGAERLAFGYKMMSSDGFHVYGPLATCLTTDRSY